MPVIAGTARHHIHAVDFFREEHAVAVKGQKCVFKLMKALEILRPGRADGGAVVTVAPGHVIAAVQGRNARIIAELVFRDFRIRALHADGIVVNLPMKAVRAEARKQIHANGQAVAAEHAGKAALIGHDGAVKHAVGALIAVARDHRVAGIAPYGRLQALRPVLPGDIGQGAAKNVCHTSTLAFLHKYYGKCCIKLRPAKGIPSRAAIKNRPRPAGRAGDGSPACPPR